MDETRANRMVETLARYGVRARVERSGVYQFGLAVRLDADRVAIWDSDGTAGLEAQIMSNGILVGFVPTIPGSADFTEDQAAHAIATTDYDAPIAKSSLSSSAGVGATSPGTSEPQPVRHPAPSASPERGLGGALKRIFRGG